MVYVFLIILIGSLLYLSVQDWLHFRLPDAVTLPLIGAGVLQAWLLNLSITESLIGALTGYAIFVAIELGFKHIRGKDGLGRGDAKLLAAGGAWCGWLALPYIVLIGSGLGLIAMLWPSLRKSSEGGIIPFGPFLALAILIVWITFQGLIYR